MGKMATNGIVKLCCPNFQKTFDSVKHMPFGQKSKAFVVDAKVGSCINHSLNGSPLRARV